MRRAILQTVAVAAVLMATFLALGAVKDMAFDNSRIGSAVGATFQGEYVEVAALTTANGDPDVDDRNYATLAAVADTAVAVYEVPRGANAATVRFRITADADTATVRCLTFRSRVNAGDYTDDGSLAYQWALTGGTMVAVAGDVYCDTGTATAYALASGSANTVQTNWIYEYEFDLAGVSYLAFYRTDATADITVSIELAVY